MMIRKQLTSRHSRQFKAIFAANFALKTQPTTTKPRTTTATTNNKTKTTTTSKPSKPKQPRVTIPKSSVLQPPISNNSTTSQQSPPPPPPPSSQPKENLFEADSSTTGINNFNEESGINDTTEADYANIAQGPFSKQASDTLQASLQPEDVEIKPDGTIYLPEIKYRRRLNAAFGPGAWAMKPLGTAVVTEDSVLSRSYQMFCYGRFVAESVGEQRVRNGMTRATAEESAKSNALMRCCKDLGIASELWDPTFIARWKSQHAVEVWATNVRNGEKRRLWRKKSAPKFSYPWEEN